ncbi:MAG: hypothetical protein L0Z62_06795 [Gemmataceae bacterium]|nr:hypothetical protein [Gemmataceae bacterium]
MKMRDWLASQAQEIRRRNDRQRLQMLQCYLEAYEARESDPDRAYAAFTQGRQMAERLNDPWWVLFYRKEQVDALLHFKRDYRHVLDLAMQCAMEVRKPANARYPGRIGVWDSLIAAYLGIDAEGYAQPIQQALNYLESEVPPEPDGDRYLLLARKRIFAREREQLQEAYNVCMTEMNLGAADTDQERALHFATFTCCEMCLIAGAAQQWQTLGQWAAAAEERARHVGHQCELSEALAWRSVAALQARDVENARRCYRTATATADRLQMPPKQGYYEALALYHEMQGDVENALGVRDAELEALANHGRLLYECRVRIKRCVLLARLGRLQALVLNAARETAQKLAQPAKYLQQLDQLAAGAGR